MTVTLYHFPPSLCSQKVRLVLTEKRVAWQERLVDIGPAMENYQGWYARLNPRMVVPTLVDDARVVVDSARIIRYIDEHFDGPSLTPSSADARATMDTWLGRQDEFAFRELSYAIFPGLLGRIVHKSFAKRRTTLRQRMAENPELAPCYEDRLRDVDAWEATVREPRSAEQLRGEATALLDEFGRHLEDRRFVAGAAYSLADAVWTVVLARTKQLRLDDRWSESIRAYYVRMRERPSFAQADIWEDQRRAQLLPLMARSFARRVFG